MRVLCRIFVLFVVALLVGCGGDGSGKDKGSDGSDSGPSTSASGTSSPTGAATGTGSAATGTGTGTSTGATSGTGTGTGTTPTGSTTTDTGPFPSAEVGKGVTTFASLVELDQVNVVYGIQGSWHITGAARACNMVGPYHIVFTITHEPTGLQLTQQTYPSRAMSSDGSGCESTAGLTGFIDASALYTTGSDEADVILHGDIVEMHIAITDSTGVFAEDSRRVTAWDP